MTTTIDSTSRIDNKLIGSLARSFLWQKTLDEGVCATIDELALREGVDRPT